MSKESITTTDSTNWTYSEFLAFLMVYGAEMNQQLTDAELDFVKTRTGIQDINSIKEKVHSMSDIEGIELIDNYKCKYLATDESKNKVKSDLEELLNTPGNHTQFEKAVVHLMERLLK